MSHESVQALTELVYSFGSIWCTCQCHFDYPLPTQFKWRVTRSDGEREFLCTDCLLTLLTASPGEPITVVLVPKGDLAYGR